MPVGLIALILATLFAGVALYISLVEQPARLSLGDEPALAQWRTSYRRALPIQGSLAVLGGVAGLAAWSANADWQWLAGGIAMLANWPLTLFVILPTNKALFAIPAGAAGTESRALLLRWGRLHAIRSALGIVAVLLFAWGLMLR